MVFKEIFRAVNWARRDFGVFEVEISTYPAIYSPVHPRAAFAETWNFQRMDMAVFEKISRYFSLAQRISFAGWGEPLVHENIIPMIHVAKKANCRVSVVTDGFHLPEFSPQLVEEAVDRVQVSLELDNRKIQDHLQAGTEFKLTLDRVESLLQLRKRLGRQKPSVRIVCPMTRLNMAELPGVVPLAARLGVDELFFIHLDYLPEQRWNILRAFYHESATPAFQESIDEIRRLGKEENLKIEAYPLQAREDVICEKNPLRNVFFAADGSVAPCPYLRIPKKGEIPRIFMHKGVRVPQTCFGNMEREDFSEIWNREAYRGFREPFEDRVRAAREGSPLPPLSETCRTCYKAYGI